MSKNVGFKGARLNLVGRNIAVGSAAPYFRAVDKDSRDFEFKGLSDKIKVITFFPSLDTPVCDLQVKEFNKLAAKVSAEVMVIAISRDLPFAQKRFCQINEIENLTVLSDYKHNSFGVNYGLLIKEWNLLARGIMIVDKNNIVRYSQIVNELSSAPDYLDALAALDKIVADKSPAKPRVEPAKCVPCTSATVSLSKDKVEELVAQYRGWELIEAKKIRKEFKFRDFLEAKSFLDLIAVLAEDQGHHPDMNLSYNKLIITLFTHASAGLTDNDFILAKSIDELFSSL